MTRMIVLTALALVTIGVIGAQEPQRRRNPDQAPQPPGADRRFGGVGMGPMQLSATGKFVYVLRGNEILQFNAESMEFVKKVMVPPPERGDRPDRIDRGEQIDRPPQDN